MKRVARGTRLEIEIGNRLAAASDRTRHTDALRGREFMRNKQIPGQSKIGNNLDWQLAATNADMLGFVSFPDQSSAVPAPHFCVTRSDPGNNSNLDGATLTKQFLISRRAVPVLASAATLRHISTKVGFNSR